MHNRRNTMAKKEELKFKNVAVLLDDHAKLNELATLDQRSMARQLSVLIRKAYEEAMASDTVA